MLWLQRLVMRYMNLVLLGALLPVVGVHGLVHALILQDRRQA
jgi:hypothetical protein